MSREKIRGQIKEIICKVTGLEEDEIADSASFQDELELDSLALIEIAVEVAFSYKLKLKEEEMVQLKTLDDAVELVIAKQSEAEAAA